MKLELKDALTVFGYEGDVETLTAEDLTKFKDENWLGKKVAHEDTELVNKIVGKRLGSLETKLKQVAKGFEIDLSDTKDKPIEDILSAFSDKMNGHIEGLKAEGGKANDDKVNTALAELDKFKKKYNDLDELHKGNLKQLEELPIKHAEELKSYKLNTYQDQFKSSLAWSDSADKYRRKGFEVEFAENFKLDLSDDGKPIIADKEGKAIKNAAGNDIATYEDVYKAEADKAGLLKKNGANPDVRTTVATKTEDGKTDATTNWLNPKAAAHLEALKLKS